MCRGRGGLLLADGGDLLRWLLLVAILKVQSPHSPFGTLSSSPVVGFLCSKGKGILEHAPGIYPGPGSSQIHAADLFAPVYSFCAVVSRPGRPIFACFCAFALLCEWLREFEFFVYGGETTRKHRAALAALVAPFRSSVGSRARAVIGRAGYITLGRIEGILVVTTEHQRRRTRIKIDYCHLTFKMMKRKCLCRLHGPSRPWRRWVVTFSAVTTATSRLTFPVRIPLF